MKEGLTKQILLTLAITGALMIAATSPYFFLNIAKAYFRSKKYKKFDKKKIARAFAQLKKNNLIICREEDEQFIVELTEKGRRKVKKYQFDELVIKKPERRDKKWRVVIFDIPEKKKKIAREALREKLKKLKFYQLQKSVWVHPYPCENEIQFLAELFEITPYVNIILADKIFNDVKLKARFGLL